MLPYYIKVDKRLISDNLSTELTKFALDNADKFTTHTDACGNFDGNSFFTGMHLQELPEIKAIQQSCSLDFYVMLALHKPNITVIKHRDDPKYRKTNLIHPLFPQTEYVPTVFWEDRSNKIACICDFSDKLPVFLNLNKMHGLTNNDSIRVNLQFSFHESFETVSSLYKEAKLFSL